MHLCVYTCRYVCGNQVELHYSPRFMPWCYPGKSFFIYMGRVSTSKPQYYKAWVLINNVFFPS